LISINLNQSNLNHFKSFKLPAVLDKCVELVLFSMGYLLVFATL